MSLPGCLLAHARAVLHHLAPPADAGRIVRWSARRDTASPHHTLETGRQLFPSSRATMYRPVRSSKVSTRARTPLYSGLESRPCTSTRVLAGSTVGREAGAPCVVNARRGSSTAHTQGGHTCLCTGFTSHWIRSASAYFPWRMRDRARLFRLASVPRCYAPRTLRVTSTSLRCMPHASERLVCFDRNCARFVSFGPADVIGPSVAISRASTSRRIRSASE